MLSFLKLGNKDVPEKSTLLRFPHMIGSQNFLATSMGKLTNTETLMLPSSAIVLDNIDGFETLSSPLRYRHVQQHGLIR